MPTKKSYILQKEPAAESVFVGFYNRGAFSLTCCLENLMLILVYITFCVEWSRMLLGCAYAAKNKFFIKDFFSMTKSAVSSGIGHSNGKILDEKIYFLYSVIFCLSKTFFCPECIGMCR